MLRRSLITFALVVSGLLITTAAGTTIQRQDLAGSRTSTREKVNTVSSSNDLLDATAAKHLHHRLQHIRNGAFALFQ